MAISSESHSFRELSSGVAEQRILRLHILASLVVAEPAARFVRTQRLVSRGGKGIKATLTPNKKHIPRRDQRHAALVGSAVVLSELDQMDAKGTRFEPTNC
jgi:hypothetical protein